MTTKEQILSLLKVVNREGMDDLIQFLQESDYFTAPASAKYHSAHEGGLAEHSLHVFNLLEFNAEIPGAPYICEQSRIITALLHDLCKVNFYKLEEAWRKDANNRWEKYTRYGYNDQEPLGHGEKSVIIAQQFIPLTPQEVLMIRWHMGFSVNHSDYMTLNNAIKKEPGIILLHTADLEATYLLEDRDNA